MTSYSDDREMSWVYPVEGSHLYDFTTPFSHRSLCQICELVVEMPGLKSLDLSSNKVSADAKSREESEKIEIMDTMECKRGEIISFIRPRNDWS